MRNALDLKGPSSVFVPGYGHKGSAVTSGGWKTIVFFFFPGARVIAMRVHNTASVTLWPDLSF